MLATCLEQCFTSRKIMPDFVVTGDGALCPEARRRVRSLLDRHTSAYVLFRTSVIKKFRDGTLSPGVGTRLILALSHLKNGQNVGHRAYPFVVLCPHIGRKVPSARTHTVRYTRRSSRPERPGVSYLGAQEPQRRQSSAALHRHAARSDRFLLLLLALHWILPLPPHYTNKTHDRPNFTAVSEANLYTASSQSFDRAFAVFCQAREGCFHRLPRFLLSRAFFLFDDHHWRKSACACALLYCRSVYGELLLLSFDHRARPRFRALGRVFPQGPHLPRRAGVMFFVSMVIPRKYSKVTVNHLQHDEIETTRYYQHLLSTLYGVFV